MVNKVTGRGIFVREVVNLLYQLSREEVLKVCNGCGHYETLTSCCKTDTGERKQLGEVKKCKKWEEYYGGPCLFRG